MDPEPCKISQRKGINQAVRTGSKTDNYLKTKIKKNFCCFALK